MLLPPFYSFLLLVVLSSSVFFEERENDTRFVASLSLWLSSFSPCLSVRLSAPCSPVTVSFPPLAVLFEACPVPGERDRAEDESSTWRYREGRGSRHTGEPMNKREGKEAWFFPSPILFLSFHFLFPHLLMLLSLCLSLSSLAPFPLPIFFFRLISFLLCGLTY